jgi:hypothetical protein
MLVRCCLLDLTFVRPRLQILAGPSQTLDIWPKVEFEGLLAGKGQSISALLDGEK